MKTLDRATLFDVILTHLPSQCVAVVDRDLRYHYIAGPLLLLLGTVPEEVIGRTVAEVLADKDLSVVLEPYQTALRGVEVTFDREYNGLFLEQTIFPLYKPGTVAESASLHEDDGVASDDLLIGAVSVIRDVSHRVLQRMTAEALAITDKLTGLGNRRKLDRALTRLVVPTAVLQLDLDGFKAVNDSRGHEQGDYLLQRVARALSEAVRTGDLVFRPGGDEFVILLPHVTIEVATLVAERVRAAVPTAGPVSTSIGIAMFPDDEDDTKALMKRADERMYVDKATRKAGR